MPRNSSSTSQHNRTGRSLPRGLRQGFVAIALLSALAVPANAAPGDPDGPPALFALERPDGNANAVPFSDDSGLEPPGDKAFAVRTGHNQRPFQKSGPADDAGPACSIESPQARCEPAPGPRG